MALWRSPVRARYGPQEDNQMIVLFHFTEEEKNDCNTNQIILTE